MTPAEHLRAALAELRSRGWCQNDLQDADGAVCVYGALNYAHHGTFSWMRANQYPEASQTLACVIREQFPESSDDGDWETVVRFNNSPLTAQTDIELVFEKAIAQLEEAA